MKKFGEGQQPFHAIIDIPEGDSQELTTVTDQALNSLYGELFNLLQLHGINPTTTTNADLKQIARAVWSAVSAGNLYKDTGGSNVKNLTHTKAGGFLFKNTNAHNDGFIVEFLNKTENTGAVTINVFDVENNTNHFSNVPLVNQNGSELQAKALLKNQLVKAYFSQDIAKFILLSVQNTKSTDDYVYNVDGVALRDVTLQTVDSVAALDNIQKINGRKVYVLSYHAGLNKGGNLFVYDVNKANQNDGIGVINGWVLSGLPDMISPFMAGAKGDYTTDDYEAINKALIYSRIVKKPVLIDGLFATSKPIVLLPQDTMVGLTQIQSRIKKLGNDVLNLAARKAPERTDVNDDYNVDAVVIFYPYDNDYANYITLKNIFFEKGSYNDGSPSAYGLYAPRHSKCVTKNLQFDNVSHGFFAKVLFLNQHVNFTSVSGSVNGVHQGKIGMFVYDGEDKMTGTSNSFERFLFVNYENAYQVHNLQTSRFAHCYGEAISRNNGADDTQVFFINNPYNLHFDCCGMEGIKGTPLYITSTNTGNPNRSVTFTGFQARWGIGGTTSDKGVNALTIDGNDLRVTLDNSTVLFGDGGFYNNYLYMKGNAVVTKSASVIGDKAANLTTSDARLIDFDKNVLTAQNTNLLATSNVQITNDLNNGIGWESGVMHKVVNGATVNVPSGIDVIYGVSVWYGLNATQGVQMLYPVNNPNVYKRTITSRESVGTWVVA